MGNRIVAVLAVLLGCQLAGEVIARMLHWPIPGPVVGMALLFVGLTVRGKVPEDLRAVGGELLANLSLLFVPAGVGVMLHAHLLAENWLALTVALVASATLTLVVTGWLMARLGRWTPEQAGTAELATGQASADQASAGKEGAGR